MAFCKVCACGEKIVFERRLSFPDNCPNCGRRLVDFLTYSEDDPRVEELIAANRKEKSEPDNTPAERPEDAGRSTGGTRVFVLKLPDGAEIVIPPEGGIVGRTELGGEELAGYPSVSRQHIRVTPRRSAGLIVEDISKYGTLLNGQRMEKNVPARALEGAVLTLCNVEAEVSAKEI